MITLDFSFAVSIFFFVILGSVLLAWVCGRKAKERNLSLDERFLWYCSVCTYTYINTKDDQISVCPRCASYNKKELTEKKVSLK